MGRPYKAAERKILKQEFLEAMEESQGMVTTSARRVGITKDTVIAWRKQDPEFDSAINEINERMKEVVEGYLMTKIKEGDIRAITFFLKCKGGYQEKQQIEVETKGDIDVKAAIAEIKKDLIK